MVAEQLVSAVAALGSAIGHLFQGNFADMTVDLIHGGTAVGIFLILLFLMKFLLELTIIRNPEQKKYATWIAVGIALIGMANDSVVVFLYNVLGQSFLIIVLVLLVVFALVIYINKLRKTQYEGSAETHEAHKDALLARKDLRKEDHDLRLQEKMEKREIDALNKAEGIVDHELGSIRNLHELVTKMRQLLGQLAQTTDQAHAQQLRGSLTRGAQALPTLIKEEYVDEAKINQLLHTLQHDFLVDMKLESDEAAQLAHLHEHLAKQLAEESKLNMGASRTKLMSTQNQAKLNGFLQQARQLDQQRNQLVKDLEAIDGKELQETSQLQTLISQLIQSLNAGNHNEALNHVAGIEQIITSESAQSRQLKTLLEQEKQLTQRKLQLDREMERLVHELASVERKEDRAVVHDSHTENKVANKADELIKDILYLQKQYKAQGLASMLNRAEHKKKDLDSLIELARREHPDEVALLLQKKRNAGL